jgi:asparagine synthase (glutamine-hydrolysing)
MTSPDGRHTIAFNGEIYNHVELQAELASDYAFRGHSDTDVILAGYARWGDACLSRLRGMFALALWDAPRRRLLCATDRLSIKPVVYHHAGGRLVLASEVKPLAAAGVPLEVNERRLFEYLARGLLDHSADTLYAGVAQLQPGTYFIWANGRLEIRRYWDLADAAGGEEPWEGERSVDRVDDALQSAVALHLRGDVAPSLSLSSGLDSQVLRALIQRGGGYEGLHCFTHCYPDTPYDECAGARRAAASAPITWHGTVITPDRFLTQLDELIAAMEGPVGGLGIYGYWQNCRTVHEHGFKVLVDGQGADEAFAGYRYYFGAWLGDLARQGDRASVARELSAFNAAHGTAIAPDTPAFDRLVDSAADGVRAPDGTSLAGDYLAPAFAAAWRDLPPPDWPSPFEAAAKNAMYRDLFYLKIPKLLRFQDRAAMAWSVEVRVPYLDHVLLETVARVPSAVLLSGGVTKALLRRLAATRLGVSLPQPKLYVSAPQREWLKTTLGPAVRALLAGSALAGAGYVDAGALGRQYDAYAASSDLGNSFFVWQFVNLELWYRRFIAAGGPALSPVTPSHG